MKLSYILIVAFLFFSVRAFASTKDDFIKCANKALDGKFGKLKPWQEKGYKKGLVAAKQRTAWVTCYGKSEGRQGRHTSTGMGVSERVAAANKLRPYTFVWISRPAQLRTVLDCGSHRNDRIALRKGADLWIDLWMRERHWLNWTAVQEIIVIG